MCGSLFFLQIDFNLSLKTANLTYLYFIIFAPLIVHIL